MAKSGPNFDQPREAVTKIRKSITIGGVLVGANPV